MSGMNKSCSASTELRLNLEKKLSQSLKYELVGLSLYRISLESRKKKLSQSLKYELVGLSLYRIALESREIYK